MFESVESRVLLGIIIIIIIYLLYMHYFVKDVYVPPEWVYTSTLVPVDNSKEGCSKYDFTNENGLKIYWTDDPNNAGFCVVDCPKTAYVNYDGMDMTFNCNINNPGAFPPRNEVCRNMGLLISNDSDYGCVRAIRGSSNNDNKYIFTNCQDGWYSNAGTQCLKDHIWTKQQLEESKIA